MFRPALGWITVGLCLSLPGAIAWADDAAPPAADPDTIESRIDALEAELEALRAELDLLRADEAITPESSAPAAPATGSNVFNPDIGINAITSLNFDTDQLEDATIDFEEIEMSIAGVVDPYASYFAALIFSGEAVEVEEAYATLTNFPADLTTTVGRRLVPLGLWNPTHKHAWPLNNPPLVIGNFLGEPHLLGTGLNSEYTWGDDIAWTASAGVWTELEGAQFVEKGLEHPLLTGRVSAFIEQPEGGVQIGFNAAHGSTNATGTLGATLVGLDAKYRTGTKANRDRLLIQGEYWMNDRDGLLSDFSASGAYLLAERDIARDWALGGRIEFAEDSLGADSNDRWSLYANWARTEFYRWRLQFDQTDGVDERISLQALITLGPHPAHPF